MVDGIDGSGKSTVISAWKNWLTEQGHHIFDVKEFWKKENRYPTLDEIGTADVIISAEPTGTGVGRVIREELIIDNAGYPDSAIAEAFSLDRLVLYHKLLIPLITAGKLIVQDRGISTSLAYQPLHDTTVTLANITAMSGNALALRYRPDHLVLTHVTVETALRRLTARTSKKDQSMYEDPSFLRRLIAAYQTPEFSEVFTTRGTQVHFLSTEPEIDIMQTEAIALLRQLLS